MAMAKITGSFMKASEVLAYLENMYDSHYTRGLRSEFTTLQGCLLEGSLHYNTQDIQKILAPHTFREMQCSVTTLLL